MKLKGPHAVRKWSVSHLISFPTRVSQALRAEFYACTHPDL